MAYEVFLNFYNKKDDGTYDHGNLQTTKKKFGDVDQEYPIDKILAYITGQLARRDIFVYDVEIFEFIKRKIPFKIGKTGLSIKNQKISYEETLANTELLVEKDQQKEIIIEQKPVQNIKPNKFLDLSKRTENRKLNKFVIFDPPLDIDKKKFPYKFTKKKKYQVISERMAPTGIGQILNVIDDSGNTIEVSDEYFVPGEINLGFDNELNYDKKDGNVDVLNFRGGTFDNMPILRK